MMHGAYGSRLWSRSSSWKNRGRAEPHGFWSVPVWEWVRYLGTVQCCGIPVCTVALGRLLSLWLLCVYIGRVNNKNTNLQGRAGSHPCVFHAVTSIEVYSWCTIVTV